jgi:hypothetical protein
MLTAVENSDKLMIISYFEKYSSVSHPPSTKATFQAERCKVAFAGSRDCIFETTMGNVNSTK